MNLCISFFNIPVSLLRWFSMNCIFFSQYGFLCKSTLMYEMPSYVLCSYVCTDSYRGDVVSLSPFTVSTLLETTRFCRTTGDLWHGSTGQRVIYGTVLQDNRWLMTRFCRTTGDIWHGSAGQQVIYDTVLQDNRWFMTRFCRATCNLWHGSAGQHVIYDTVLQGNMWFMTRFCGTEPGRLSHHLTRT
jgi:hypothetical protein